MSEHAAVYEILAGRDSANGTHRPQTTWTLRGNVVVSEGANVTALVPGTGPIPANPTFHMPPSGYRPNGGASMSPAAHVVARIDTALGRIAVEAYAGETVVMVNGAALDNGGVVALDPEALVSLGRQAPPVRLTLGGAAEAAVLGEGGITGTGSMLVHLAYPGLMQYAGLQHFLDYENQPPDSAANGTERLRSLIEQINRGGSQTVLGLTGAGAPVLVNDCGFAGGAPEGVVFVEPGDIGNAPEQIPISVGQNSAAHFRYHPSVFLRRTDYVRQVSRQTSDPVAVNATAQGSQPIMIAQIVEPLQASDWWIVVDGVGYNVRLRHPFGIGAPDVRRPRDIWNRVWVPILQGSQAASRAVEFLGMDGTQTGVGLVADRLRYLSYARMWGLGRVFSVAFDPQDDTDPPG